MYDLAMTIYFGMYGATMTTNSELFWGPDSIMMLPCDAASLPASTPSTLFSQVHELCRGRAERLLPAHDGPRLRHHVARLRQVRGLEGRLDQADDALPRDLDSDLLFPMRER